MGRKAGRAGGQSGARQGRDQIPRSALPPHTPAKPPPAPACGSFTSKGSMFLFHGGLAPRPSSLYTPAAPSHQTRPRRALCKGFHLCDSSTEAGQPGTPGYRFGQKGPQKAENVGRRRACIVPTCCQPQSPTGSRRHVADVREDKGRHGPHQPPVIDGLCLHGRAGGQRTSFS